MSRQLQTYLFYGIISVTVAVTAYYGKQYYDQKPKEEDE